MNTRNLARVLVVAAIIVGGAFALGGCCCGGIAFEGHGGGWSSQGGHWGGHRGGHWR